MGKPRDLTGQRFGRLLAIRNAGKQTTAGNYIWLFQCDCGTAIERPSGEITRGATRSCGCLHREEAGKRMAARAGDLNRARATHRMTKTPTFTAWVNMIQRCTNPKHKSWDRYGGRGITVCERWLNSFEAFLEDMGEKPEGLELDREKNHLGYEPGNCRWATRLVNSNNRDVCHAITFRGRTQNIKQWAAEFGLSHQAINQRLKAGWSVEEALTIPKNYGNAWIRGTR